LTIVGESGHGRAGEAEESIGRLVTSLKAHFIPGCGHVIPEEAPEELRHTQRVLNGGICDLSSATAARQNAVHQAMILKRLFH